MAGVTTLIVGAAGFVGSAVAWAATAEGRAGEVACLVRRPTSVLPPGARICVGDARKVDLGLDPETAGSVRATVRHIIIAVGSFDVGLSLRTANEEHIAPVSGTLSFARTCPALRSVVLMSSLLAVGDVEDRISSSAVPVQRRHRNFYEWAKLQTERLGQRSGLPLRVVRAGQVVNSYDDTRRTRRPGVLFEAIPYLLAGWPLPVTPRGTFWCCPVDFAAQVVLATALCEDAPASVWAVDPASPQYSEVLDVMSARHRMGGRRVGSTALARLAGGMFRPVWLGLDLPREVLGYCSARWELDLHCIETLCERGHVKPPPDRSYLVRTIDHEVARYKEFADRDLVLSRHATADS
jgi:nucleoside-diphosphate-sugar epimerase